MLLIKLDLYFQKNETQEPGRQKFLIIDNKDCYHVDNVSK